MEINRAVSGALTSAKATTGLSLYEQATGQKLAVAGSTKAKRVIENPDGKLDGNDFLKLFLESLKHQDPTSPVETKDMMAQTAQLTTVETNVAIKKH